MSNGMVLKDERETVFKNVLALLDEYHHHLNSHDLEGVITTIHSSSPANGPTRQILGQLFNVFRLRNELIDTKYIGDADDYVFIRMKQRVTKITGPEFKDNISDSIVAAKKEGKVWKVWSMMPLEVNFCDVPGTMGGFFM
jgi:hypothetical protein